MLNALVTWWRESKQDKDAPLECGLDGNTLSSHVLQPLLMDHRETGELGAAVEHWECIYDTQLKN